MSSPRAAAFLSLAAAAFCARAEEYDEDFLTPRERRDLELRRRREAEPVLSCSPTALSARLKRGETDALRLSVRNSGGRALNWKVRSAPEWAKTSPSRGRLGFEGEQSLTVFVDSRRLPVGKTWGEIVIEAPGAAKGRRTISIVVQVEEVKRAAGEPPAPRAAATGLQPEVGPLAPEAEEAETLARAEGTPPLPGFGLRLGFIIPSKGADEDFDGTVIFGFYYRLEPDERELRYELGLDLSPGSSSGGDATARQLWLRAAALYGPVRGSPFYVLGGGELAFESYENSTHGTSGRGFAATLDLGAGFTFVDVKLDLRATYSLFLGSTNVPGAACLTVGYSF